MKKAGRAPYLHILRWLSEVPEWTLSLRDAMRSHSEMRGSVGQVVDKGHLRALIQGDGDISAVIHYDEDAEQLTVEDPQFIFFIRNIPWRHFASTVGFMGVEFPHKYDFALSFAGEDRDVAEALFSALQEHELEVFYDHQERHRILAADVEEYLRPIYQSEAQFVVVLIGPKYPKKIWTKFESEQFKSRFDQGAVIPVWLDEDLIGLFDESRRYGGFTIGRKVQLAPQIAVLTEMLVSKLGESRR